MSRCKQSVQFKDFTYCTSLRFEKQRRGLESHDLQFDFDFNINNSLLHFDLIHLLEKTCYSPQNPKIVCIQYFCIFLCVCAVGTTSNQMIYVVLSVSIHPISLFLLTLFQMCLKSVLAIFFAINPDSRTIHDLHQTPTVRCRT